jgi:hypothetical protein
MKIKFKNDERCKYFEYGNYQFFAYRQGKEGYTLNASMWYHVPDQYQTNKYCSKRVNIAYEPPCSLDKIRERIIQFLNAN